ncbi:MAG: hypothetical protein GF375_05335, partial [Candidatus Omnitrophica bacterium]|nr:hypothetical protein [Candidatus Omnitrophota bacterium]MBD3269411.1 hypothetical protein [Candidatus Omnitrophota bacterium]
MFLKLRSHHIKIVLWILIIVIVPAFVLWGTSSLKNRKQSAIASIEGEQITTPEFREYLNMARLFLLLNASPEANITYNDIERTAFELIVLLWKADKEDIRVSDAKLADYIIKNFSFKSKFDQNRYEAFIKNISQKYNLGLTPRAFEENIRRFIRIRKLFERYVDSDVSQEELRDLYNQQNQTAKISYIFIPYKKFRINAEVTLDKAREFYEKNKSLFREKEKIKIKYL